MGRPFEGWSRKQIEATIGDPETVTLLPDFFTGGYPAGQYTDDTQLTMAIAESIIRSKKFDLEDLIARFIEWLDEPPIGPGYGCLSSIKKMQLGYSWQEAASDSGGNGTAMRVSPIGLFYYDDIPKLIETARASSIITHKHWAATGSAIVVARTIAYLVKKDSLDINDFLRTIAESVKSPEFEDFAERILNLKDYLTWDKVQALIELGGAGIKPPWPNPAETRLGYIAAYAMSTTLSALYCFLLTPHNFANSIIEAVIAGGDTDTCGAITGSISGAFNGLSEIPSDWVKKVVNREKLKMLGRKLYELKHEIPTES